VSDAANGQPFDDRRRHTLFFLDQIRDFSPVFLDTEVDSTALVAARSAAATQERRLSVVTAVVHVAARVLREHPDANSAIDGTLEPRVAVFDTVSAKVTLDKRLDGKRVVLATVIPDLEHAKPADIQDHLDRVVAADADTDPEFAPIRGLRAMPHDEALQRFRAAAHDVSLRPRITGTFSVTSLGHRAVDGFHSVGGTTITVGVGQIRDRAVVRDGEIVVAPVMRLSLAFDHRVIDGAEAADVLTEIKEGLEEFSG
jgi:pyruvate/2-oxoglutarate dehydrogenase complex dihydrolipoamide acyltransferase (E2) component